MPTVTVDNFGRGLDARREEIAALPGSLSVCINAHVNRGGEIEKRMAAVAKYTMTGAAAGATFGLAQQDDTIYVFGSAAPPSAPDLPAGVTYQRLQHPTSQAMTAILDVELFNGKLYVIAKYADGSVYHFYNGTRITDWFDGKARAKFTVTAGTAGVGNQMTSIKVNGVEILNAAVAWATDHTTTAAAIATQINTFNSTPEYTAVSSGAEVTIISSTAGAAVNGLGVVVQPGGTVAVNNQAAAAAYNTTMSDGVDNSPGDPGTTAKPLKDKMYTVAGRNVHFSALRDATKFNTSNIGAGFVTPSMHASGSASIYGLETFYGDLAIFAGNAVQIWFVDADDENNELKQVLGGVGTTAPRAITPMPSGNVRILSVTGVRDLAPRDNTDSGTTIDSGAPIDKPLLAHIASLSAAVRDNAVGIVDPREGRYWLAIGNKVYVLSNFPEAGVYAWAEYQFGFTITDFVTIREKLYFRSGDVIYLYGGDNFDQRGTYEARVRIPYLDASRPSGYKDLQSIDILAKGTWTIKQSTDYNNPNTLETLATTTGPTVNETITPVAGRTTQVAIELTNTVAEDAKISAFILHYRVDEDS